MILATSTAAGSSYAPAIFGLAGSLIGGFIAGFASLLVARQARRSAERAWIRDNRRDIYDRFLTSAQQLLIACETRWGGQPGGWPDNGPAAADSVTERAVLSVASADAALFEAYGVVQTVAGPRLVAAARDYANRLLALEAIRNSASATGKADSDSARGMGPQDFGCVAQLVRAARHDTIDAMRAELGLEEAIWPPAEYNPFRGTVLEQKYAEAAEPGQPSQGNGRKLPA